ncbi:expressed unknown protein [Seminavis robusta]|uniref:Uncharacterized protein n=1 Tax=Seminavis robusta TaxID=568900 RepID=A0A9N8EMR4_9STRA|nr:expressed unknown protein [Seminavis robusta]|eukprot:Sro1351_g265191.1  (148) ;mRNA; f:5817-6260
MVISTGVQLSEVLTDFQVYLKQAREYKQTLLIENGMMAVQYMDGLMGNDPQNESTDTHTTRNDKKLSSMMTLLIGETLLSKQSLEETMSGVPYTASLCLLLHAMAGNAPLAPGFCEENGQSTQDHRASLRSYSNSLAQPHPSRDHCQ